MFGRGKAPVTSNQRFIMAKGRAAGNVKRTPSPKPMKMKDGKRK